MPPTIKISKEQIIEAALEIIKDTTWESVNARELAKRLDCSTHPIFRVFKNMEDLKCEVYANIEKYYNQYIYEGLQHEFPFYGMGISYIKFAREETSFFKILFMSDKVKISNFSEMISGDNNEVAIQSICNRTGLNEKISEKILVDMWMMVHGIASMVAYNTCNVSEKSISEMLTDVFTGLVYKFHSNGFIKEREEKINE